MVKRKFGGNGTARKKARYSPVSRAGYYGRFRGHRGEEKFFDTANSFTVDLTAEVPATGQLNLVPQGVTESTRVGRKIWVQSISMRGVAVYDPAATNNSTTDVVLMVVQDTQCNGAAAAATDVMEGNLATTFGNLANQGRFKILKRFVMNLASGAGVDGAYGTKSRNYEWHKNCNIPIEFDSTTGVLTEVTSNNLFLLASSAVTDDLVTFTGTTRIRYTDN